MAYTVFKHIFTGEISVVLIHDGGKVYQAHWFRADNIEEISTFLETADISTKRWNPKKSYMTECKDWTLAKAEKRYAELVKVATTTNINFV